MGISPMMEHYLSVKEKYKDCIIFYRLGDFYEMFFDDAKKASELLDLTLTGRDCGLKERAPMCGVPFHSADSYIAKLVGFGEKVAICEQLSTPGGGKELVQRDVIRIITAGTLTDNTLIDDKNNNFICCVFVSQEAISISWADITTGEFLCKEIEKNNYEELFNSLVKINPAQIICNSLASDVIENSPLYTCGVLSKLERYRDSEFNINLSFEVVKNHFNVSNLLSFGISDENPVVCSSGALLSYLIETQKKALLNINFIKLESDKEHLLLDLNTVRNLEITKTLRDGKKFGSLLWLLDKTKTSMGARKLQNWILYPLNDEVKINERLNAVESLFNSRITIEGLTQLLSSVKDVGRLTGKISNGNLLPKDCVALASSLELLPNISFLLSGLNSSLISRLASEIIDFSDIVSLLKNAIADEQNEENKDFKYIKKGFNAELDELRDLYLNGKKRIALIESQEREATGIKNLKIGYNRVFGYYIEVTNSFKDKIPYHYHRRQTLANAERYVTEELKQLEIKILTAEDKALQLELKLFGEVKNFLSNKIKDLMQVSDVIANLDVLSALAIVAKNNGYVKPVISTSESLSIIDGRHPVVEKLTKQRFICNDCILNESTDRTMIITGPNMAGKSTYMRQVALITIMAHIGSFVPAKEAIIPIVDKVFTRIGASDSLITDQSTFMVEMSEVANIINNATNKSLLILDEIGRGTSTYDGLSIAWAIVEYINNVIKAKTLFATHYHELTELEEILDGVKNYKITVKEVSGTILFLRKIIRGGTNKSFGIEVAELAGVSKDVVIRAKELLNELSKKDLTKKINQKYSEEEINTSNESEVERILKDVDINNISPMQAFIVLSDLVEKVKG